MNEVNRIQIGDRITDHKIGRTYTVTKLPEDRHDNLLTVTREDGSETLFAMYHVRASLRKGLVSVQKRAKFGHISAKTEAQE